MQKKIILVVSFLIGSASSLLGSTKIYKFGIVPQFEARKLEKIWVPLLKEISARTNHKFVMVGSPRIPEFEKSFLNGDFDFAYLNPYHALLAFEKQNYFPILKDLSRKLYGVLVVKKDSKIKTLTDLQNKKISFPSPNALGASLLIRSLLTEKYKINFVPIFSQTHTSTYLNVLLSESDAAGGVYSSLQAQKNSIKDQLKIIYETPKVPPHPIVVHPGVERKIWKDFRNAFIKLSNEEKYKTLFKQIPMKKPGNAQKEDYKQLEEFNLSTYYVEYK